MKKIFNWMMLAAAVSTAGVLVGQEEADNETAAESAAAPGGRARIEEMRQKVAAARAAMDTLKAPNDSLKGRIKRSMDDCEKRIETMVGCADKAEELSAQVAAVYRKEFAFTVVPEDQRMKFAEEGEAKVKRILALLGGSKVADQVAGIELFEKLREEYQGAPGFKEAAVAFDKTVKKLERSWKNRKESEEKRRQKLSSTARAKVESDDESTYERVVKKMDEAGKDASRDWIVPNGKLAINLRVLDRLLSKTRSTLNSNYNKPSEEAERVTERVKAYWDKADEAVQLMQQGSPDKALDMLNMCEEYREVTNAPRSALPEAVRESIRDQHRKIMDEVRARISAARRLERELSSQKSKLEREAGMVERAVERMIEEVNQAHEDEERRAAEEAERKAEEERIAEEERKAAEEEEADEDEEAEKPKKKKKSKKKAKSAEDE